MPYFVASSSRLGRTLSIVFASCAVVIVGDTTAPNVSLSNHTHIAASSLLTCVSVHAASPLSEPGDTSCVPLYDCEKLSIDVVASALASLPPTNMKICASLPGATVPCWYTAET